MTDQKDTLIKNKSNDYIIAEMKFIENNVHERVNIFLVNGVKLEGTTLLEHDEVCIIVTQKNKTEPQLIYKSSIATIQSTRNDK